MKFFKCLIMQSPLPKPVSDPHRTGEVSFQHPESDLGKHRAPAAWSEPTGVGGPCPTPRRAG